VLRLYFDSITSRDYMTGWQQLGPNLQSRVSYDRFVDVFATTGLRSTEIYSARRTGVDSVVLSARWQSFDSVSDSNWITRSGDWGFESIGGRWVIVDSPV
jgi:hypothetical protein